MLWSAPKIWKSPCWIIGGGVSIAEQFGVPDTLIPTTREEYYQFGEYLSPIFPGNVIGVNVGAFVSEEVKVAFWGDSDTYSDFRNWFDLFTGLKVSAAGKFADKRFKSIYHMYKDNSAGIPDKSDSVSWVAMNSASAAISLAYHLGARTVYLLGVDLCKTNERTHWHSGYPDKRYTPTIRNIHKPIPRLVAEVPFEKHSRAYPKIAKAAQNKGMRVINVSPKSTLDCFKKMTLEQALVDYKQGMENGK